MPDRKTILLIDSFADEQDMYAEFLRFSGFELTVCRSPERARHTAAEQPVDAIVTRIRQPGPIDGIELTRQIKNDGRTKHIPVVIITTHTETAVRSLAQEVGCDVFLVLPCLPDALVAVLQEVLQRVPAAGQPIDRDDPPTSASHHSRRNQ